MSEARGQRRLVSVDAIVAENGASQAETCALLRELHADDPEAAQAAVEAFLMDRARAMADLFEADESEETAPRGYLTEEETAAHYARLGIADVRAALRVARRSAQPLRAPVRPVGGPGSATRQRIGAVPRQRGRRSRRSRARSPGSRARPSDDPPHDLEPPPGGGR